MEKILPGDWTDYYKIRYNHPARKTLIKGLEYFDNFQIKLPKIAVDIGCGQGSDIAELINQSWTVIGIDKEKEAIGILTDRFKEYVGDRLIIIQSKMEEVSIQPASLVNASYSLPFCNPENFIELWNKIDSSLPINGIFCGQLFGVNDSWSINSEMTFHDNNQVQKLFEQYEFIYFRELEEDGETALNNKKHWHIFHIAAIKQNK